MSTSGGYHEYTRGEIMIYVGDTVSTSGMFSTSGGYDEDIGGIS